MAVDSGTYTDDTIWRRRQIAQALADLNKQPIKHWTQGLSNLANTAVLSYDDAKLAQESKQQDYDSRLAMAKALGADTSAFKPPEPPSNGYGMISRLLGGSSATPTPTASPAPSPVVSNAAVTPSAGGNLPAPPVPWQSGPGFAEIGGRMMGDLQRDFKLTPEQAAGVVGNLGHESGGFGSLQEINPTVPGSRGGFGYAQWTGPRRVAFENWAQSQGLDPTSYDANYGFLRHELTNTPEGKVLDALRAAPDQDAATRIFQDQFLRPGIPHTGSRLSYAKQALELAGGPPSAAVPFPSGAPQEGMPSFVPQGDRVQMAALPPATMTDASPAGPAPAGAETPSPGLPAFAQNGVPPVAMGAPSSPSPASPQQPPLVAPPSPAMPPPVVAGAPASMSGAPRPGVAGVQVPDGIKRIAGALMASPRTAGQGQKMVTDFLVKELSRNPLDDEAKRIQIEQGRANLLNAPIERRIKEANATKAERDLLGEGARPLTAEERKKFGISDEQPAYRTRNDDIKFGPAGSRVTVNNAVNPILKGLGDQFVESAATARSSVDTIRALHSARSQLDEAGGVFSGFGADAKLALQKIGSAMRVADPRSITNTETFRTQVKPIVLETVKGLGAGSGISNADREFALQAVGGDINLDESTIRRVLDIMERAARYKIERHNTLADKMLESQKDLSGVSPMLRVDSPGEYVMPKAASAKAVGAPVRVQSIDEAKKLPSGTVFVDPNGVERRVP